MDKKNKKQLKFYHGLIIFAVMMAVMIIIAFPAQMYLGIYGLAVTEILLLFIAVLSAIILNADLKSVFSFKLPSIKSFFGGLFVYSGTYLIVIIVLLITEYIFPSMNDVSQAISDVGTSASPFISLIIIAFLPALCEEALHRGILLSSFKHLKNPVIIIFLSSLLFGLFHLDPYRLASTAILGAALSYIAYKTDSLLLPVLFHFLNNTISVYAMFATETISNETPSAEFLYNGVMLLGMGLIYGGIALVFLYIGWILLKKPDKNINNKISVLFISLGGLSFISGIVVYIIYFLSSEDINQILNSSLGLLKFIIP